MSSRTVDPATISSPSVAGTEGFSRPSPVCTEIGVSVQGTSHSAGAATSSQPFVEQTTTVIVFAQGAVVRLSESVTPGQILILRHLRSNEEAACHVISVKANSNVKGYVELEFLQPAPSFWGVDLPAANAGKSPSVAPSRPESAAEAPKAAATVAKPASPATAPRYSPPPSEEGTGVGGPGLSFLPDLLESLGVPADSRQRPPESATRPEIARPATAPPPRAERVNSNEHAESAAPKQSAPARPAVAPWVDAEIAKQNVPAKPAATPWVVAPAVPSVAPPIAHRPDITKGVASPDPSYLSDLLDTLTPVGETILRERSKTAAPEIARSPAKPPTVTFVEPVHRESTLLPRAQSVPAPARKASTADLDEIGPDVAPMRAGSEVVSHGQLLGGEASVAKSSRGLPKPMRILAVAAVVTLALAAGVGAYRWEKRSGAGATPAPSSQPNSAGAPAAGAPTPSALGASASNAQPSSADAANSAPAPAAPEATTTKNSRGSSSQPPAANAPAAKTPSPAAEPTATSQVVRGSGVPGMKMTAPAAASHATNQSAPSISGSVPGAVQSASVGGMLDAPSNGPAAPAPVRTSSGVQQAKLLSAPAPAYPYGARTAHVEGDVSVDITIEASGKVSNMTVLSGPTLLRQAALDALRERKYTPAILDGRAISSHVVVIIHFQL